MGRNKSITETGPKALKGIRNPDLYPQASGGIGMPLSDEERQSINELSNIATYSNYDAAHGHMGYSTLRDPATYNPIPREDLAEVDYGSSTYDDPLMYGEVSGLDIQDLRGQRQPWYAKLGAGVAKGVALAGTTFLDGTIGLVAGVGTSIREGRVSGIWDNEISNSLAELNRELETVLPNYMTAEEQERPWYQNLGTMNFWANNVIKNLGFTVGAFYSGGAWTKALKGIGWLKGSMGAKVVGSALSAINEGRIEANNNSYDFLTLKNKEIDDMVEKRRAEIMASEDTEDNKNLNLILLEESANKLREDAKEKADAMGLTTLIGNTVLLSLDNFAQFGKLYARGFKNAKGLASGMTKAAEEMATEEAGKNIIKQGSKYAWKDITKKKAFMKGLKNGLLEGNEEIAQAFIAETAGNMQSYDSPDAYYEALTDKNAQLKTKDFLTSVTEGLANTYGTGDRWEEFAVGAFTGLLGMPTFGKVNNSDANTYLGRGRSVGLSGGLFGEIRNANQQNREGREAVDVMNKYVDKMQNHARYFAQSQSFTDAMDGWAEADDAFEYKNAENNDDFSAISRFAQTGKLSDLKEMVNQSFENLSDEELVDIAMNTSPNVRMGEDGTVEKSNDDGSPAVGGWRNTDGSLMSDTEEGRKQMREELIQKRDKILSEIDKYEKSVETVRAIGNNSLTEDQVNELAWLNWKVGMFTDRYNSIKAENEEVLTDIQNSIQAFQKGRGREMIDEESDEGKKLIKAMENTEKFISALRSAKTPLQLGALVEANPHLTDFLEDWAYPILEDITGIDAATFEKAMTDLRDTTRIAKATRTFNQRYKEFKEDPIKLIKNRERIDKKKEKVNKASEDVNLKDKVNNSKVSDLVQGMEDGDLDSSQLDGLFAEEDPEVLNQNAGQEGQPQQPTGKQKVEEAKKIIETAQRMNDALGNLDDSSIDPQAIEDARTLLKHSKSVSESEQEMLNTASEAYNDPNILYDEDMQGTPEDIEEVLNDRIDVAKSVIERVKAALEDQNEELDDLPEDTPVAIRFDKKDVKPQTEEDRTTGHDETTTIPTENERQKEIKAKEAQAKKAEEERAKINDLFSDLKEEVPQGQAAARDKAVTKVLDGIDRLIKANATPEQIGNIIKSTQSYQTAKQLAPGLDDYLNVYITSKLKRKAEATEDTQDTQAPSQETRVPTPTITEEEVRQATTAQMDSNPNQEEFIGTYQYWKPTLSYLPFGKAYKKGNTTPFYKLARTLKNSNGTPMYTEAQLRRIEAVGKYLDEHNTFKLVDSGAVKVDEEVRFFIDSSLNDAAGEIVILMIDSQNRVIGDVMSPNDSRFARQLGLPQFVDRITKEYQDAGSPQNFISTKETTIVASNKVGKIPFLADNQTMNTLNEVHSDGGRPIPFKIGIAVNSGQNARILATAGRTKGQGQSELEKSINPPLTAKAGQPFLLVPTSSEANHYMTAPFVMESYNPNTQNTALGKAIRKVLERIPISDNATVMGIINDLEELLSVQEIHINYDGDNVKVTIKPNGAEHQRVIYNGNKNNPTIVDQIEYGLQVQQLPFQVSRKYINEDYYGQDYNRMIGEIARINLPIGATHTVSDWFTINPISTDGKPMKAKSPRSTGSNPYAATPQYITITKKGVTLNVKPGTWEVTDDTGKVYEGPNANKVKAQAFGIHMNKNMEKPYNTDWGYYDPKADKFIKEPSRLAVSLEVPQDAQAQQATQSEKTETLVETPAQLEDKAKKAGLLGNKVRQALWQVLSPEQQATIANKKGPKQKQWMDALEGAFNATTNTFDEAKLKGTVDEFLGRKALYSRTDEHQEPYKRWNKERELQWLRKALPNLSTSDRLTLVNRLIRINDSSKPGFAYGKFQSGMITISELAARGTAYHEAFHAVVHTLLNEEEYQKLFDAASERWSNITDPLELEEKLAEDFRMFMQSEEEWYDNLESKNYGTIRKTLAKLFHKLKNFINRLSGKTPYINKLYYNINRGKFARRKAGKSDATRFSKESYTSEMQSIKDEAIADGTFMKAPNGKDTNLTERQWLQVRTKAFKEWFGDWETIAYDNSDINSIKNLKKLNTPELLSSIDAYLEHDFLTEGLLSREAVKIIKQLFNGIESVDIYEGDIEDKGLSFYSGKIVIKSGLSLEDKAKVVVHEILHNFTVYAYDTNDTFRKEINGYHKKAYIYARKNGMTLNSDVYEFMANILSPETTATLMSIPSEYGEKSNLLKDIIKAFVSYLRRFFEYEGVSLIKGKRTLFHDVVESIYNNQKPNSDFNNTVSKVVDENGEPLVVYHGSKTEVSIFDSSKSDAKQRLSETIKPTNFFSSDKTVADFFAITENQQLAAAISRSISIVLDAYSGEDVPEDIIDDDIWTEAARRTGKSKEWCKQFWEKEVPAEYKRQDEFGNTRMKDANVEKQKYQVFLNMRNPVFIDAKGERADEVLEKNKDIINNNDEVIILNIDETVGKQKTATDYLVRKSNQIKSATDNVGTFDPNNPDIRFRYIDEVRDLERDIEATDEYIKSIRDLRGRTIKNKATKWITIRGKRYAQLSNKEYLYTYDAIMDVPSKYRDLVEPIESYGSYYLYLKPKEILDEKIKQLEESKEELKQELEELKRNKENIISEEARQEQEEAHYRRIEQYHIDKRMYDNLPQDDKEYLTERGITPTEYSQMTQLEKEVLFHCKY